MTSFNLEKKAPKANSSAVLHGVYWSARDMDNASPIGNHHFITFVYQNQAQAERLTSKWRSLFPPKSQDLTYSTERNEKNQPIFFSSLGFGSTSGNLSDGFNPEADRKSLREVINPDKNTSFFKPDFDYEGHRVPHESSSQKFGSVEQLMEAIVQCFAHFDSNYSAGKRYKYSLLDANCASVVNTIMKVVGYSQADRKSLGQFFGIDWGEMDLIPEDLFAPPAQPWDISDQPRSVDQTKPFHGIFSTGYGTLRLIQNGNVVIGDYRNIGIIKGQYNPSNKTLEGFFINDKDRGRIQFQANQKGFDGKWAWGENQPEQAWNGTLIASDEPELANTYFEGTYETEHGQLRLHQDGLAVFGDYKNVGVIEAIFDPKESRIIGRFTNGTRQGRINFKLTDKGFDGLWAWDDSEPNFSWHGTKISWAEPELSTYLGQDKIDGKEDRALLVISALETTNSDFRTLYQFLDQAGVRLAQQMLNGIYQTIVTLEKNRATFSEFIKALEKLTQDAKIREVDVILHCHGSKGALRFTDRSINAQEFETELHKLGISHRLRMFYTTACYAESMLDAAIKGGFTCACGAKGVNANSPVEYPEFLEHWRKQRTFKYAVEESYNSLATRGFDAAAKLVFQPPQHSVDSRKIIKGNSQVNVSDTQE